MATGAEVPGAELSLDECRQVALAMRAFGIVPRHWWPYDDEVRRVGAAWLKQFEDPKPFDRVKFLKALEPPADT